MQFGKMRHVLEIQNFTIAKDAHGHPSRSYSTIATVRGTVNGQYGIESVVAERVESRAMYRVNIRYRNNVTPQMRLIWKSDCDGDKTLEIQYATDMQGSRRILTMLCMEVVTNS